MQLTKTPGPPVWAVGLMSGTSLDGIDAALVKTDGRTISEMGGSLSLPYTPEFQEQLRKLLGSNQTSGESVGESGGNQTNNDALLVERELTMLHAEAVHLLLKQENMQPEDVAVIGFHGQTISHRPDEGVTWQIGNSSLLTESTGVNVVSDFRRRDMAAGGQGAPLVPIFHQALMAGKPKPVAVLNIGGVANVTWIGEGADDLVAFDTGPGNALINDWVHKHTGKAYDEGGVLAAKGNKVDQDLLGQLMSHEYFTRSAPKSLDRNSFDASPVRELSLENGTATLTAFTIESVLKAAEQFPAPAEHWYVCGGGRLNATMMEWLAERLGADNVSSINKLGYDGDMLEAQAFAYLAVRSLQGLPLTFPGTTGSRAPVSGGVLSSK